MFNLINNFLHTETQNQIIIYRKKKKKEQSIISCLFKNFVFFFSISKVEYINKTGLGPRIYRLYTKKPKKDENRNLPPQEYG